MRIVIATVLLAVVAAAPAAAGQVAVALLLPSRPLTLTEAKAVDILLDRLADQYGAAYTIGPESPWADRLRAARGAGSEELRRLADALAADLGADRVIVMEWAKDAVRAVDASGELGTVDLTSRNAEELALQLFQLCTGAMAGGAAPAATLPGQTKPEAKATSASAAGGRTQSTTLAPKTSLPGQPAKTSTPRLPRVSRKQRGRLLYEMAVQSYRQGNYELALDQLTQALRAGADASRVLELQARIYGVLGDIERQSRALRELLLEDPGRTRAAVALALLLDQQGLWQQAVDVLQQAIEHSPRDGQLYVRLAQVYQRQGRTLKALEVLQRGYEATGDPQVGIELARALDGAGDWRSAMAMYSKLAAADDARVRARALDALGDLYARMGMLREAVEAYTEAAKALGAEGTLTVERYRRIYTAADRLIETHLQRAWQAFQAVAAGTSAVPREEALSAVQAAVAEAERVLALAEGALPPPELEQEHRQRKLYYALVREALVAAATFIDTGRKDMADIARQRMAEALREKPGGERG